MGESLPRYNSLIFTSAGMLTEVHSATTTGNGNSNSNSNGDTHPDPRKPQSTLTVTIDSGVAVVEFSKGHRMNPFSQARMRELNNTLQSLGADDHVRCIVLTGGAGRSFGAGGDFNETSSFEGGPEIDAWLDDVTGLYTTLLELPQPVVAAIDGHAVGFGLQVALCCDLRLGAEGASLMMPEFAVGIACNFGAYMLEAVVGRRVMQNMLFTAAPWTAAWALADGLLHEVVPPASAREGGRGVVARAVERARKVASWAPTPVRTTRAHMNAAFARGIRELGDEAKRAHRASFSTGVAQANMKQVLVKNQLREEPSWVLVTNESIPSLAATLQRTASSGVAVYGQGAVLNSETFSWLDLQDASDGPSSRSAEGESDADAWGTTSIDVRGSLIRLRTGAMNDPPLYMVRNTTTRAWAVGTDTFALHIARSQWGMPVGFADPTIINRDGTTSFLGVAQLPAHSRFELRKDGPTWSLSSQTLPDPVVQAVLNPTITDFERAGTQFVEALRGAVVELTGAGYGSGRRVATLLSGGIDSGAVTTLAVLAGLEVTAYSAGSPWGNEHAEAKELTSFLGIPHVTVDLSAEELLAAAPESMRALGTAEQERVDIALTITAMLRGGIVKEKHVLTGYGNDLLNLGLPPDATDTAALSQEIIDGIDITRHSGEFTDFVARQYGKRLSHPYWAPAVVQAALRVHPSLKIRDGREKAFFRAAMEPYVPKSTAWRKKIGIHLGGGLQGGLDRLFGGRERKVEAYCDAFKAITTRLLRDPLADIKDLQPRPDGQRLAASNGSSTEVHTGTPGPFPAISQAVIPSGAGLILDGSSVQDQEASVSALVKQILRQIEKATFIVVKRLQLGEDGFKALVRQLGEPVAHKFQTGSSDLMKLPATRDKGNVVLGRGMLPVHTDGLFVGHRPDLIMLYAAEFSDVPGSGETTAVDQVRAVEEMSPRLREALRNNMFEYQIVEQGHHMKALEDKWFEKPPMTSERGRDCIGVSMPFPDDTDKSWNIRVKGATEEASQALLEELNDVLYQERYFYSHPWEVGDLLVLDNFRTLHGRTAISEGGQRCLWRGQVNRRPGDTD